MTSTGVLAAGDAACEVLSVDQTAGWRQVPVESLGTRAVLHARIDQREDQRRSAAGLGAITTSGALEMLLSLPVGEPVPATAFTRAERRALKSLPAGAVCREHGAVVRSAVPAVEVKLAVVAARSFRHGLESAGRFAPFCARAMVLRRLPREMEDLRMEADFFGVGVIIAAAGSEPRLLVPPAAFRRHRFTAASWRFLEQVYGQVR